MTADFCLTCGRWLSPIRAGCLCPGCNAEVQADVARLARLPSEPRRVVQAMLMDAGALAIARAIREREPFEP